MKMLKYSALTLMVAMAVIVSAQTQTQAVTNSILAQQAGPQGGQRGQGGPGGAGEGQMRGGMRMGQGPVDILRDPKVQQHLKLSQNQIEQINEAFPMRGPGGPGGPGGEGDGKVRGEGGQRGQGGQGQQGGQRGQGDGNGRGEGGPGGPGQDGPQMHEQMMAKIKTILNANQFSRFEQLALQKAGAIVIARPDISEKLGLSETQLQTIREIIRDNQPGPGGPGGQGDGRVRGEGGQRGQGQQGGPGEPGGFDPAKMQAKQDELNKKILAVLTNSQRSTWNSMLGDKFEFSKPTPPRGGQGGGGGI